MRDIDTPNWSAIDADAIRSGVAAAIDEAERRVDAIASVPDGRRDFENTVLALDGISDLIGQASGQFGFLSQVAAEPALRSVAHEQEERLDVFASGLGFREEIDRALKAYATRAETQALPDDAARLLEFALRDYRRNGFDLPAKERDAVQELHERLVRLGIQFRRNIDDYEDHITVSRRQLGGLPDSYIERLQSSEQNGATSYRVSLDYPELHPFLDSADDGELRRELFLKNHNKSAGDNIALLEEAIGVRDEIARRLGYPSWAAYVLELRMAKSPDSVMEFLTDLEGRLGAKLGADLDLLRREQARRTGASRDVDIWGLALLHQPRPARGAPGRPLRGRRLLPARCRAGGHVRCLPTARRRDVRAARRRLSRGLASRRAALRHRRQRQRRGVGALLHGPAPAAGQVRPTPQPSRCAAGATSPPAATSAPSRRSSPTSPSRPRARPRCCATPRWSRSSTSSVTSSTRR